MGKFLLTACIFTTLSAAMCWQLEQDYHLTLANREDNPPKDCSDLILDMMDCVSFLSGDENTTKPSQECCKGLKTVLDTNEKCLCYALEYAPSLGITVNMSRAEVMPSLCHLDAPPISTCNISVSPAPSPATPAPSPSTPATPSPSPAAPTPTPAPEPVNPNPPAPAPVNPNPPAPAPAPVSPNPPPAPTPATPLPAPPTPSPPSTEPQPPASPPESVSGAMHIQMPFLVSFAVIVVSFFFV